MTKSEPRAFLVPSGYNFRAVLAFCRALRAVGQRPAIIACTEADPVFKTDFAGDVVFTRPSHTLKLDEFIVASQAAGARAGVTRTVLAPASEFLVRWALRNRAALATAGCDLPLPSEEIYLRVTEKGRFTEFCRDLGLPVPVELPEPVLPCVAKPKENLSLEGRSLYPWLLREPADVARFRAANWAADFFFQEWVSGRSFYLLLHVPQSGLVTAYSQENLAQQAGGKSVVFARAAKLHEMPVATQWTQALQAGGFFGLVMIELRQRGSDYVLIEANPRLWGPLQLCVDGCPALVRNYIAEHTRRPTPMKTEPAAGGVPHYVWRGGLAAATAPDWHEGAPRFRRLSLWRHVFSDVYLRPDSWHYFLAENSPAAATAPMRSPGKVAMPAAL